jgi:hypothetical protein
LAVFAIKNVLEIDKDAAMKIQASNITEESRAINLTVVLEKRGYSVTTKNLKSGWRVVAERSSGRLFVELSRPITLY